jgi:hypothetical protein
MVARGKDVSDLFPAVVKNVAAKNLEVIFLNFLNKNIVFCFISLKSWFMYI